MKWQIPAKTFLLGEYAALTGAAAIIITTYPCFTVEVTTQNQIIGIHPDSPAGQWWSKQSNMNHGITWHDPYQGIGGLGASSAQFIGAYLTHCYLAGMIPQSQALLQSYYQIAWHGAGLPPSGYDVLAQLQQGCVYLNRDNQQVECFDWPFNDISFLLLHSGYKLATHQHLTSVCLPENIDDFSLIVEQGKLAFASKDSKHLIAAVNAYQQLLSENNLTSPNSLQQIDLLKQMPGVLAVKGCGAMGADVLLLLIDNQHFDTQVKNLHTAKWCILASNHHLYNKQPLIKNLSW